METAIKLWARNLCGIEDEYINSAMESCVDKFSWPPDVSEFKQLAMSFKGSSKTPWSEEVLKFEKSKNNKITNLHVKTIIDEGSDICKKLKNIYPDKSWMAISSVFTKLKQKARVYYPVLDDIKLIRELMKYSDQDVLEMLGVTCD